MEEKERDERKEKKQNKRKIQGPNSQPASYSQPASQLIRERREGDTDDESLVRNEWERKRKREKKEQ